MIHSKGFIQLVDVQWSLSQAAIACAHNVCHRASFKSKSKEVVQEEDEVASAGTAAAARAIKECC